MRVFKNNNNNNNNWWDIINFERNVTSVQGL